MNMYMYVYIHRDAGGWCSLHDPRDLGRPAYRGGGLFSDQSELIIDSYSAS